MKLKTDEMMLWAVLAIGGWWIWRNAQRKKAIATQRALLTTTGATYVLPPDAT